MLAGLRSCCAAFVLLRSALQLPCTDALKALLRLIAAVCYCCYCCSAHLPDRSAVVASLLPITHKAMQLQQKKHVKQYWRDKSWDPSTISPFQLRELGCSSVAELAALRDARINARCALSEFLERTDVSGPDKQRARCAFTHRYGRLPYQCERCWLLPGYCVCSKLRKVEQPQQQQQQNKQQPGSSSRTKVVIHLHLDEWGRGEALNCVVFPVGWLVIRQQPQKQHWVWLPGC